MKRCLAVLLAVLLLVPAAAAEWDPMDPNDPLLWEPDLPEFDGPMPRTGESGDAFSVVVSFTGDMLLASLHGKRAAGNFLDYAAKREPDYFLQHVRPIFEADDFTVVNLENVLTDRNLTPKEKSTDPAYWYRAPAANTKILTSSGVEAVSLANNHTGDYSAAGYKDTEKESDFQVVFYHGGEEGVHAPEAWRVRASRKLVDGGADLVLGNHPHVLQPREVYKDKEIVYSLGNFCYGGSRRPENRTIIYQLTLRVENGVLTETASEIIPCYVHTGSSVNNYCPAPIEDEDQRRQVLNFMDGKAKLPC